MRNRSQRHVVHILRGIAHADAGYRSALKIDPYAETAKQHLEAFRK